MTTPTTPRSAILDLADRIDAGEIDQRPEAWLVHMAGLLRSEALKYSDEPTAQLDVFETEPSDFEIRSRALDAAATCWAGMSAVTRRDMTMLATAQLFETYLRGEL